MNRRNRRYFRTLFLGMAAMAALVWSAVDQFGMAWQDMRQLMLGAVLAVVVVIVAAGLGTIVWLGLRKLFSSSKRDTSRQE